MSLALFFPTAYGTEQNLIQNIGAQNNSNSCAPSKIDELTISVTNTLIIGLGTTTIVDGFYKTISLWKKGRKVEAIVNGAMAVGHASMLGLTIQECFVSNNTYRMNSI